MLQKEADSRGVDTVVLEMNSSGGESSSVSESSNSSKNNKRRASTGGPVVCTEVFDAGSEPTKEGRQQGE